jgi:hypothetical protein
MTPDRVTDTKSKGKPPKGRKADGDQAGAGTGRQGGRKKRK